MDEQNQAEPNQDIFPRDQLEHYKVELTRLRAENNRLSDEVDYLRQALAAALSKMPWLEAPPTSTSTAPAPDSDPSTSQRRPSESGRSMETYVRYFSLASLMASPVALLVIVMLGLLCAIIFLVAMSLLPNGFL
jgi:hypothetical protein